MPSTQIRLDNGFFSLLPSSIITDEILLRCDYNSIFFCFSKVNKYFRSILNDWSFINKIRKQQNIFDFILLEEFKNKLNSPELKYHIIIKPCLIVNQSFEKLRTQEDIVFSESDNRIKKMETEEDEEIIVYKPDIKRLLHSIHIVHDSLKRQYPIFLQQLGYLCSYIGAINPDFQNIVAPYGLSITRQRYQKHLDRSFLFPFTSYDWAGHGEGGESDGTVILSNDPKQYGRVRVTHSVLFTWEKDYEYEKIEDPDTDDERASHRAKRKREDEEEEQEGEEETPATCSAVKFLARVLDTLNADEGNEPEELVRLDDSEEE